MSFNSSFLQDTVGFPSIKALTEEVTTFVSHVFPPMLCYFVMAVLAITPQTRTIRIILFPITALLALRAAVPVDMSLKFTERKLHHCLAIWMFVTTTRALGWALARKPLVRQLRPVNSTPSTLMDALDLVSNFRGYGWDWSRGVHIPRGTRPSNRTGFILYTILSAAGHAFAFGILHTTIRVCFPVGLGNISGGSIFDESFPRYLRFLRSCVISNLAVVWTYAGLQMCYDSCTILGVLILGQDPTQWPPLFDAPWRATSLTDFWGRRWQQLFRKTFLILGGYPLSFIFGRVGIIIGAFFISAVFHHIALITLNSKSEFWRMLVGFEIMAVVVLIEDIFKYVTGRKVGGPAGWVWTMVWILLWSNVVIDGCMRAGLFGFPSLIDLALLLRILVEYMVTEFDNLLHAISSVLIG
ncbi:hypothetical protein OG21DRAFT_1415869 [Imleria badia]|nr:hypothetical protein OG21DRAFT_1415869 [Imleria badia]